MATTLRGVRSGALDFPGTKAARADVDRLGASIDDRFDAADVGLPGSVGFAVGMGNVVSEHDALAADTAFCHTRPPHQLPRTAASMFNRHISKSHPINTATHIITHVF